MTNHDDPQSPSPQSPPAPPTFEQALARLEQIVLQLEDGRADLGSALAGYEEGIRLLRQCHGLLERAERRIEILSGVDAEGRPVTEPFDDASTLSLSEAAQSRSKRRSTKKPAAEGTQNPAAGAPPPQSTAAGDVDEGGTLF